MISKANFIELLKVAQKCTCKVSVCSFNSKIPLKPYRDSGKSKSNVQIENVDLPTIELLERLSLVSFGNVKGVEILESSIKLAETLIQIETSHVKPLVTVLETENLHLRNDRVTDGHCRMLIMNNAKVTEEEYFVAPPGNIPLEPKAKELLIKERSSN